MFCWQFLRFAVALRPFDTFYEICQTVKPKEGIIPRMAGRALIRLLSFSIVQLELPLTVRPLHGYLQSVQCVSAFHAAAILPVLPTLEGCRLLEINLMFYRMYQRLCFWVKCLVNPDKTLLRNFSDLIRAFDFV